MIVFEKVTIQNFKSFGNKPTTLLLDKEGSTLILGSNEDIGERGNSRNGCGKSASMSAIVFALYGKDLDKLKPDELINLRNGKKLRVELEFSVKGEKFKIVRGRKPNILELYHGDKSLTRDSMKNTEQEIMDIIDIPYDVFLSVFFLNPFKDTFMSMTSAAQRNFMESVLSLDTLAARAEGLKAIKKELTVDLKLAQKDLDNAVKMREREEKHYASLIQRKKDWDAEQKDLIEELLLVKKESASIDFDTLIEEASKIKPFDMSDGDLQRRKKSVRQERESFLRQIEMASSSVEKHEEWEENHAQELKDLEEKISSLPSIDDVRSKKKIDDQIFDINQQMLRLSDQQRTLKDRDIPELEKQQEALEKEFDTLEGGKCPYCNQKHTDEDRLAEIADEFEAIEERRNKLDAMASDFAERQLELQSTLEKLKDNLPSIDGSISEESINALHEKLEYLRRQENPHPVSVDTSHLHHRVAELDEEMNIILAEIEEMAEKKDSHEETMNAIKYYLDGEIGTWDIDEIKKMKWEVDAIDKDIEEEQNKENPYIDQVKEAEEFTDVHSYDEAVEEIAKKEKHCSYLIKMLTDPKSFIRKNIVDQYVPFLNKKINEYTQYLDLPHVSEINSDMTVDIEYMGKSVSYFTLSRGERLRVDIATAMAFRDLLKMMGNGVNLLLVDEVLDSALDPHGTKKAFNFIRQFASNTLLISHREEFQTMVDEVMIVNKRNGFTVIDA